jgi:hypothetical protein
MARSWLVRVIALGPFAAVVATPACTNASRPPPDDARTTFATEHYCPAYRVGVQVVDTTPPAPPAIAADRERWAMWRDAALVRAREQHYLLARGCEEYAVYKCWYDYGREICIDQPPGAPLVNDAPMR